MPKTPSSCITLYRKWVQGGIHFVVEKEKVFCKLCSKTYEFKKKCQLDAHKETVQHQMNQNRPKNTAQNQQLLTEQSTEDAVCKPENREFANDVILAFLQEGIPLHKLEDGPLRNVLEKYCKGVTLPSVRTMRRMVPNLLETKVEEIRKEISDSRIWLSVDEATDSLGRYIANVVVGKLYGKAAHKGYLLHVAPLNKTNSSTIVQTVQEALRIL